MPQQNSITSSPRVTSPIASESTLPCSEVRILATSSRRSCTSSRMLKKISARFASDTCRHSTNAAFAACTAASTSSTVARSTAPVCLPLAGLKTGPLRPESEATLRPPIQWLILLTSACSATGGLASSVIALLPQSCAHQRIEIRVRRMTDEIAARVARDAGVDDLVDILSERVDGPDLASLLLAVFRRRAARRTPAQVLERYQSDRFVRPSSVAPESLDAINSAALAALPPGFERLELSPVCPLGTSSVLGGISQDRVVATVRNTEVVSDPTNVLALECALRRRADRSATVKLAATQRALRATPTEEPYTRTSASLRSAREDARATRTRCSPSNCPSTPMCSPTDPTRSTVSRVSRRTTPARHSA